MFISASQNLLRSVSVLASLCIFAALSPVHSALAEDAIVSAPATTAIVVDDQLVVAASDVLPSSEMESSRGSGGTVTTITVSSDQTISATSTGNSVNVGGNMTNGPIAIGNNFGGSGFGSYVLNTGNNATINSGVSLSVLMTQ